MKHAFIIMAHVNFRVTKTFIEITEGEGVDFFIHFDKKVKELPSWALDGSHPSVHVATKRRDIRWGDCSLANTELEMLRMAYETDNYDYFHITTGDTLPIKSRQQILGFFEEHKGKEFIKYMDFDHKNRVDDYYLLTRHFRDPLNKFCRKVNWWSNRIFPKKTDSLIVKKSCQAGSITNGFCRLLLDKEGYLRKRFAHSYCSDEHLLGSMATTYGFADRVYPDNMLLPQGCMVPAYLWVDEPGELEKLEASTALWARKFDENLSWPLIEKLRSRLLGEKD